MNNGHQRTNPLRLREAVLKVPTGTVAPDNVVEFIHGLGRTPVVQATLVCDKAELSYTAGDEIPLTLGTIRNATNTSRDAFLMTVDNRVVRFVRDSANVEAVPKGGGAHTNIDNANWRLRVICYVP